MAKEYIEREALLKTLGYIAVTDDFNGTMLKYGIDIAREIILKTPPAADVVEVVRCQNCDFWESGDLEPLGRCALDGKCTLPKYFCPDGERRENGNK